MTISPTPRRHRARRALAALTLAVGAGTLAAACVPPPPTALEAPFTCSQVLEADGWVKILTVLRYIEPTELTDALSTIGWDGLLAEIEADCAANPGEVITPEYDAEDPTTWTVPPT